MIKFKELYSFHKKEIQQIFSKATFKDKIYGLKLLQAPTEKEFGKILLIIPGKFGKAHDRNKIRRQIKAIFYEEKLFKKKLNSILLVYKPAQKLNFRQIKEFLIKNFTY